MKDFFSPFMLSPPGKLAGWLIIEKHAQEIPTQNAPILLSYDDSKDFPENLQVI